MTRTWRMIMGLTCTALMLGSEGGCDGPVESGWGGDGMPWGVSVEPGDPGGPLSPTISSPPSGPWTAPTFGPSGPMMPDPGGPQTPNGTEIQ